MFSFCFYICLQVDADQFLIKFGSTSEDDSSIYADYDVQTTHVQDFLAFLDAMSRPVDITDRVLALRKGQGGESDDDVYLPATVLKVLETTLGGEHTTNVLVAFHGGELEALPQHHVIKISASRYLHAVAALTDRHGPPALFASRPEWLGTGGRPQIPGTSGVQSSDSFSRHDPPSANGDVPPATDSGQGAPGPAGSAKELNSDSSQVDLDSVSKASNRSGSGPESLAAQGSASSLLHSNQTASGSSIGGQWWPKEQLSSGRVLNVSSEYQDGFEAGFAAAQQILANTEQQRDFRPPSPETVLKSWYKRKETQKSKAEFRQSSQWQYSTKLRPERTLSGRSTTLAAPSEPVARSHLQGRPWTVPTQLMGDDAFDSYHRKQVK